MPAAHRPLRLQPVAQNSIPKLRTVPTPLRIEHPDLSPAIPLVLEENPTSALSDHSEPDSFLPPKPKSLRNQKNLCLNLSAASSNASSTSLTLPDSPASAAAPIGLPPSSVVFRRRPSVVSLPNATSTLAHRREEEGSPSVPYIDGPIQILPGVWIGSEDNARDWKDLLDRGIKSILNVAKEVACPYACASQAPLRPTVSTPNLTSKFAESMTDPTYVPPHGPSGRPAMHYLRLPWSHGQADLVRNGFVDGMLFVDESLKRGDGVLIHCQCGVSRSATMVIALVMRAAQSSSPSAPPEVQSLKHGGMHASYAFVKEKSKWIGPNMSLMYQLLEYERSLNSGNRSATPSDRSSQIASEEAEWGRKRQELDEASPDEDEQESAELMREARALDLEMEQRMVSRKGSQHSTTASTGSGIGMGSAWKSRFGHGERSRAGSFASNLTNRSVLSEDLLEEDEDTMVTLLDIPAECSSESPSTEATEEEARASIRPKHVITPTTARLPPTAPATKQSFGLLPPPSARHSNTTFGLLPPPPSAPAAKQLFTFSAPPSKFKKRRPPPLLPPVPPSPVGAKSPESESESKSITKPMPMPKTKSSRQTPAPLLIPSKLFTHSRQSSTHSSASSNFVTAPTPSQTLFVFPPEESVSTPSTMTLTSSISSLPFPTLTTPRVSTFKKEGRRRSLIVMGAPPTPTVACSRVDALGFVALRP